MMKKIIVLLVFGCFCFSCSENKIDTIENEKVLLLNSLDVNLDGKPDFKLNVVEYSTRDYPSSAGEKIIQLNPIDENLILYSSGKSNALFLQVGDTIKKEVTENLQWSQYGVNLISKKRRYQEYDEFWTVASKLDEFYLAIKLNNESIGWLQLEFNLETGEVFLLNSYLTKADELKIEY